MSANPASLDRLMELLAVRAIEGLDAAGAAELERLLKEHPGIDANALDRAASAVWMEPGAADMEPLPAGVRDRILAAASETGEEAGAGARPAGPILFWRRAAWVGWLAAAACLGLALLGWWPRLFPAPVLSAADRRAQLMQSAPDVRVLVLQAQEGAPAGFQGDVVWSDARKEGYLRLQGLAANDPGQQRYQAWIFDATRPADSPPVGAGLFDALSTGGEVVISLDPSLGVGGASAFGITIERPDGSVLPTLSRLVALGRGQP